MDSINQQQAEDNFKNLEGKEAIEKLKELVEKAETCFFCSDIKTGLPFSTRPMAAQKVDADGNIWFLSSNDSNKNAEINLDPYVQALFQGSKHSAFLSVYGISEISEDRSKIDELWDPIMKTWFQGGKDDPRISVIKVIPSQSYYWDTKHGEAVSFLKMAASVVSGKTMDDSIEGDLKV
ncbi:pyridoxamine 5'-phosphate oxidase family protein [Desertivirga brevis]|uniref:pyridoxamine 5'-phosphate oxidase family protein n=1 Tax=Desertivirga brevis TaxID=2810310 RepID=UPI001A95FAD1|nr:pyridoxamine 5'-phosphate oxidase family protein [Pedobacter sp. SYSU D00873]